MRSYLREKIENEKHFLKKWHVGALLGFAVLGLVIGAFFAVLPKFQQDRLKVAQAASLLMEWGTKSSVDDDSWSTINFNNSFTNPVFVCTTNYNNTIGNTSDGDADSITCRARNLDGDSVEVRLQEAGDGTSGSLSTSETVHWVVVEEGSYDTGDIKLEAFSYNSTVTDHDGSWSGEEKTSQLSQSYTSPVVLGQVMTYNDTRWSTFWSHDGSLNEATDSSLYTGKHVAEDGDTTRSDETVGVIVIEEGNGTVGGVTYEAALQGQSIDRIDDSPPQSYTFNSSFSNTPSVGITSVTGMNGTNGSYPTLYGSSPLSTTEIDLSVMEDEINDGEMGGVQEHVPYIVFESSGGTNSPPDAPSNPSPSDGAEGVSTDPTLSVDVSDPDGDSMDVCFYDASDNSQIGCDNGVASGNTASVTWSNLTQGKTYNWYAIADDGSATTQSSTWSFKTEWVSGAANKVELTIDNSNIDSDLTHFPISISLGTSVGQNNADVSQIFDEVGANWQKIAVTKSDQSTQLYVEREKWDASAEEAVLWVSKSDLTLSSSSKTSLYLYYDNSQPDNSAFVADTGKRTEVWDSNFEGVWHLSEDPSSTAPQMIDSTSNNNDGSTGGSMTSDDQVAGQVDGSLDFDGSDDYIKVDNYFGIGGANPRTTNLWFKGGNVRQHSWVKWGAANTGEKYYIRSHTGNSECELRVENSGGQNYGDTPVCDDQWHMLTVIFPEGGDSVQDHDLYVDASLEPKNGSDQSMNTDTSTKEVHIGHPLAHHKYADGIMDEVRISDIDRSVGWVKASYHAQTDNLITWNVNSAPDAPSNPSPLDGAEVKETTSQKIEADVSDPDGDSMDIDFRDNSDDSLIGSNTSVPSGGRASTTWSSLSPGSTYNWYAVADDGSTTTQSSTWSFTVNQTPDVPSSPSPSDGANSVSTTPSISATYSDPDGESGTLRYYAGDDSSIGSCSVSDGSSCSVEYSGASSYCTSYSWYAVADDGTELATSSTWSFKTNCSPDAPTNPSPSDGATDVSLSPELQADVSDPDGDSLDVSFYDASDDSLINRKTGVISSSTATSTWTGLECDTSYSWYVVADDGTLTSQGSTWSFTTRPVCSKSNTRVSKGFLWIEDKSLHWTDGSTEWWVIGSVVATSSDIRPGHIWVEGAKLHWIDAHRDERSYKAALQSSNTGLPKGKTWLDGSVLHYIDQNRDERTVDGT